MTEYLQKEIQDGLDAARKRAREKSGKLRVVVEDRAYRVLRFWDGGFALDAANAPRLRGVVDIYEGSRHQYRCLIVTSEEEAGEMVYEFKWHTLAVAAPARDFAPEEEEARVRLEYKPSTE